MRLLSFAALAVLLGVWSCQAAATYHLKSGLSGSIDWSDLSNYVDEGQTQPPQAGDTVVINSGSRVTARYGTANFELVTKLALVQPLDDSSLTIEVTEASETAELGCAVSVYSLADATEFSGRLIKSGNGTLKLNSSSKYLSGAVCYDYHVDIYVQSGMLCGNAAASVIYNFRVLDVGEGAIFLTPKLATSQYRGWRGKGTITNDSASVTGQYLQGGEASVFEGAVAGENLRIYVNNQEQNFTGVDSTYGGGLYVGVKGSVGVSQFGYYQNSPGGFGLGLPNYSALGSIYETPGIIRYLGYGEETEKVWNTTPNGSTIDAGANGGITFKGAFKLADDFYGQSLLYLTGSNKTECVLANEFNENALHSNYYITKQGSGTYRFADCATRTFAGPVAVEEGTVRYDSMAEAGVLCSLGYSTRLYTRKSSVSSSDASSFAFLLGQLGSLSEGYFVSAAAITNTQQCSTRLFGIEGVGGFITGSSRVSYAGVQASSAGAKTLVLDGEENYADLVTSVYNGSGKVGVEKRGKGKWLLKSPFEFDGPVSVLAGELEIVHGGVYYDWYRLRFRETAYANPSTQADVAKKWSDSGVPLTEAQQRHIALNEFALIDEKGNRCVAYPLTHAGDGVTIARQCTNTVAAICQPGEIALGNLSSPTSMLAGPRPIAGLFEYGGNTAIGADNENDYFSQTNSAAFDYDTESSWVDVIFRSSNATGAAYCDLNFLYSYADKLYGASPTAFTLEGSVDGLNWDTLLDIKDIDLSKTVAGKWYSSPTLASGPEKSNWPEEHRKQCFHLTKTEPTTPATKVMKSLVSVAPGARLKVRGPVKLAGLQLRRDGMGELVGVSFNETGTLDVPELTDAEGSVTYHTSVKDLDGAEYLADWIVTKNGGTGANYSSRYDPETGDITIYRGGSAIIVR